MARTVDSEGEKFLRSISFTREQLERLQVMAVADERSISWLVRQAVKEYLERHQVKPKGAKG